MELVEFFAGAGVASLGLKRAGFTSRLAVEWDPCACAAHRLNHPGTPVVQADMFLFTAEEVLRANGISPGWKGLVWLSPPCQCFSTAGDQNEDDQRATLLMTAADAAKAQPKAWICVENVKNLLGKKAKRQFERLRTALTASGRRRHFVWILDASNFGVAQHRERVFILATPEGYRGRDPVEPTGATRPPSSVPLARAIGHAARPTWIDEDGEFHPLSNTEYWIYHGMPPGGNWKDTEMGRRYRDRSRRWMSGGMPPSAWLQRLSWDEPARTVMASVGTARSRLSNIHPSRDSELSVGEMKELMGLPKDFILVGGFGERVRQVGNGVVVPVAEAVGRSIIEADGSSR